ncbi:MAG: HAMP domain-containing histidine kinase, partial [Oscillospiraceae bacterium]|nr:HAMP domain-containing histidine kinase [Oscillospiraceae bacterium]
GDDRTEPPAEEDPATAAVTIAPVPTESPEKAAGETRLRVTVWGRYGDPYTGAARELNFATWEELDQWAAENSLSLRGYILADLPERDEISQRLTLFDALYGLRFVLLGLAVGALLLGLLLFVFLMSAAGHRDGTDAVTPNAVDKIPFDLFLLGLICLGCIPMFFLSDTGLPGNPVGYTIGLLVLLSECLLALLLCMSFATRLKLGTLWSGCLLARLGRWLSGLCKRAGRGLGVCLRSLPILWRWLLILGGLALLELMLLVAFNGEGVALWFVVNLLTIPAVLYAVLCFRRLRGGVKAIAGGDTGHTVDTRYLLGEMRDQAEDLNRIQSGIQKAVDERMKSERFRTELITNVSHDIKTPLTSIINYVDLLEKEGVANEKQQEYLEVLARQSARLKKLIDDLMDASKASTGNLPVDRQPCELGVLVDQTAGEYGERLAAAGLTLLTSKPETPVTVLADGRHLWRIFDNLMNNILKYALPGTRVYLDLEREGGQAAVTFRNISRSPLNISGEELLERFVRGDSSRNTEGSGLGLSIAQSLARLQGGDLTLTVDGDLFKVCLRLPILEK